MSLLIRKPGILTTVQDLGRLGSRRYGINPNGAMDVTAVRAANIALGNNENEAALEMHFPAPEIEFSEDTVFCLTGADFGAELEGQMIVNRTTVQARKGQVLRFRKKGAGNRAYLTVKYGFDIPPWLGSSSTNMLAAVGGYEGRPLRTNDVIRSRVSKLDQVIRIGMSLCPSHRANTTLRIVAGGEFELLTAFSEQKLLTEQFVLTTDSNRMGFRLGGAPLHLLEHKEMVSSAMSFGTIQLLPDGQMIVLMADHQTTGGYPRIANVITADLPIAGQLGPRDGVSFELVTIKEAEDAQLKLERDLRFFRMGCRFRSGI